MRIIVNGTPLLSPRSGVGNYVFHTFKALLSLDNPYDIAFYYGLNCSPRVREMPSGLAVGARRVARRLGPFYWAYREGLDFLFRAHQWRRRFDFYHETNFIPLPFSGPMAVNVHDLSFLLHPETHPAQRLRLMERRFYPRLDRIRHFMTLSEAVKSEMVRHLGLPPEKITVIYPGVDESFSPVPEERRRMVLSRYGLESARYLLTVSTLEPRKNILRILQAYGSLPSLVRETYPLALAGGRGWLMGSLEREMARLGIRSQVRLPGHVPDADLPALYSGAAVFLFPSLYEGFGLPALEAMACGVPVISSTVSSLPEVVGDAGLLVNPLDVEALRDAIQSLLDDPGARRRLGNRGMERARRFSWRRCAEETLKVYGRCLSGRDAA